MFRLALFCTIGFVAQLLNASLCPAYSQPAKIWDARFGGAREDRAYSIAQAADSGYLIGGYSISGSGFSKSQPGRGGNDFWIIKTDSSGQKKWDKRFGGNKEDVLTALQTTSDKGFILAGNSLSSISGDKTQAAKGAHDYWVIKINASGTKQWDKSFGGALYDYLTCIKQTNDGGYLLGGYSSSGISGDKSDSSKGSFDFWILKTDSSGNKQWDKSFGGSGFDALNTIEICSDGGFLLGGYSTSDLSGDKTQNTFGSADYWVIKVDETGNKQWDKSFGGSSYDALSSITVSQDGTLVLGGYSSSNASGNKISNGKGGPDYWIIKTDNTGNKIWDQTLGTRDDDYLLQIKQTVEGGYLLGGYTVAGEDLDKTVASNGANDYWIIKTDSLGQLLWDKSFGGPQEDKLRSFIIDNSGFFVFGGNSNSESGGDKSESALGDYDQWIIKACPSPNKFYHDIDNDGFGNEADFISLCTSEPPVGYTLSNGDCNDSNSNINPIAIEIFNGIDDNCNGLTDENDLHINVTKTNVLCKGDSVEVAVGATGGNAPYTGSGVFILPAGSYNFKITDVYGFVDSIQLNIDEPPKLQILINSSGILCKTCFSSVTVSAFGGVAPYTGTGNFSVKGGNYTYTVSDSNGCSVSQAVRIDASKQLKAMVSVDTILCYGGTTSATVIATGGKKPYSGTGIFSVESGNNYFIVQDSNGLRTRADIIIPEPIPLTLSISAGAILCNGGTAAITVSADGGKAPYAGTGNYTVVAGTYIYTVTDANGCNASDTIILNEPDVLQVSIIADSVICIGDSTSLKIMGSGGTEPYSGIGAFYAGAGNYTYTITDANGCISISDSINIKSKNLPPPSVYAPGPLSICTGSGILLTASGYKDYIWNNGMTNKSITVYQGGNYIVTGIDNNGCTSLPSDSILVVENPLPQPPEVSSNQSIIDVCPGKTVVLKSSNATYYFWNTGILTDSIVISAGGDYFLTITDSNGCRNKSEPTTVTYQPCAAPSGLVVSNISSTSAKITWNPVNCAIGYQFEYRKVNTTLWTTGQTYANSRVIKNLVPSTIYEWRVITGCKIIPDTIASTYTRGLEFTTNNSLQAPTRISKENLEIDDGNLSVLLYPNPCSKEVTVQLKKVKSKTSINIFDITGRLFLHCIISTDSSFRVSLDGFTNGLYFVEITDKSDRIIKKLIVNR